MSRPLRAAPATAWQRADKTLTGSPAVRIASRPWYGRRLALDFRILGPLEVRDGENVLHLGGAKQRGVLAILLLRANEVVSSDRLIDELWGETPPEDAAMALQAHVSRLRKALPDGPELLVTRAPGYGLRLDPGQLDLDRFESLVTQGRTALESGDPALAAGVLRTALELWRGRPLADLEAEPFAREAAAQLEDAWLDAIDARIEADLRLARHAEFVTEIRALVRAHPLREGLRAQLMLALYRSGRQAEALDVYTDARRTLDAELGLEPGPALQRLQRAILAHDAALAAPDSRLPAGRRRRVLAACVAAVALVVAALAVGVALGRDDGGDAAAAPAPGEGSIVSLDASTGEVRRRIPAGRTPSAIAARDGVVWVVDADAQTVLRLSESSRVVDTFSTGATPTDVALGSGSAWIGNGRPLAKAQFVGPVATAVARLDVTTGTERAEIRLPRRNAALSNLVENHIAFRGAALWTVTPDFAVVRIEAATGAITARSDAVRAAAVASGPAGVWVLGVGGSLARLHERTARPIVRTRVPASSVGSIAVGPGAVWVTSPSDGMLWRIGGGRRATLGAIELDRGVSDVVVGRDAIWVANPLAGTLLQVDPERATVERTIDLGGIPRSVAVDGETVWVASVADPTASTIEVAGVQPFPASTCEPVLAGRGSSDVLLVSDLPLQGGVRVRTTQMMQAIAFVLRERDFRAGRFKVAYQSCDDSVARTGLFDEAKCAANARAYADNPDVVGVIGTFNSPCAVAALPELNRAPGGPLAMVSPSNSFVGLTRAGPGVDPALPAALYPTGRRNYLRVYPTDDLQDAALALLARQRGHRAVYILDDGDPAYGVLMATAFETAARRLGLTVSGRASWDPQAKDHAALVDDVLRSSVGAVFLGGLLDTNAAGVIRDLRARLGTSVDLLAPDGLTPLPLLVERAGPAALGMYVSLGGAVTERLPAAGARFVDRFKRTQPGVEIEPSSVYAAQATEVLLDAIARSDGTRASVVEELFETRVRNGLLGSFGFDRNGDITESPVTILRVRGGGSSTTIMSVEGGMVARVVRPSARLVAPEE
jgi:DNA-binding SARP family transcriptional activator/ABC-type branched-subunit amino acid transport system substrate-binding protein